MNVIKLTNVQMLATYLHALVRTYVHVVIIYICMYVATYIDMYVYMYVVRIYICTYTYVRNILLLRSVKILAYSLKQNLINH